jgi:hypothetical protein
MESWDIIKNACLALRTNKRVFHTSLKHFTRVSVMGIEKQQKNGIRTTEKRSVKIQRTVYSTNRGLGILFV